MMIRTVLALLLACVLALPGQVQAAASIPASIPGSNASLLPWLDYYIDESGTDVEEIALNELQLPFARFNPMQPIRTSGTFWLRFTLAPREPGQKAETWMLDMGESIPGKPVLYQAIINDLSGSREWREVRAGDRHVFLLPEAGLEPQTCFIRLSGAPGIWFSPMLRTPHDAANNWKTMGRYAVLVALCAVMLFCLLRSGGGQWRIWTGLFAAAALAQGIMGLPAAEHGRMGFNDLPAALLPGLALMLLPQAGRHLMHSEVHSRSIDYQLLALTFIGAAVALVPLVPGMAWLARYLDLWPLVTACFLITALAAVFLRLRGSKRFLLACLLPPAVTLAAIMAASVGVDPEIAGAGPLLGVTLSTLALATSKSAFISAEDLVNATINLEQPLDDPNLRIVQHDASKAQAAPLAAAMPDKTEKLLVSKSNLQLEDALRLPLDRLMREGAALGRCSLPPAVRQYSENMLEQARHIADIISHPTHQPESKGSTEEDAPFNLQHLMREAHDTVAPLAENANIGLAWYMPPHLGQMYKGAGPALQETLCMLLESAVRATMHGAVHFSVRRVPESEDAGHLLFTITDTGSGMPPKERSSLALSRAWELAGAHKGYLGVESSPHGATIAFTLHLECLEQEEAESILRKKPLVLICAESAVDRQSLGHMLSGLKCRTTSARTMNEALQLHKGTSAVLFIAHGNIALKAQVRQIQQIHEQSAEAGMPPCHILAITPDESQWKLLSQVGFTHALAEPVNEEDLRHTVQEILDKYAAWLETQQPEEHSDGFAPVTPAQTATDGESPSEANAGATEETCAGTANPFAAPEAAPAQPLPGQPVLPNLFHNTGQSQQSPMQIPDLTALPDLLHFAETMGQSTSKRPAMPDTESASLAAPLSSPEGLLPSLGPVPGALPKFDSGLPPLAGFEPEPLVTSIEDNAQDDEINAEFMAAGGFGGPDWVDEPGPNTRGFNPPDEQIDEILAPQEDEVAEVTDMAAVAEPEADSEPKTTPETLVPFEPLTLGDDNTSHLESSLMDKGDAFATFGEWVGKPTPYVPTPEAENETTDAGVKKTEQKPAEEPAAAPAPKPMATLSLKMDNKTPETAQKESPSPAKATIRLRPVQTKVASAAAKTAAEDGAEAPKPVKAKIKLGAIKVNRPATTAAPAPAAAPTMVTASEAKPVDKREDTKPVPETAPVAQTATTAASEEVKDEHGADNFMDFFADMAPEPTQDTAAAPEETSQGGLSNAEVDALLERLDTALADTKTAFSASNCAGVRDAAHRIVTDCNAYGLHVLGGIAGCVERAAQANDLGALKDLLPDLYGSVERNRISFSQTMS